MICSRSRGAYFQIKFDMVAVRMAIDTAEVKEKRKKRNERNWRMLRNEMNMRKDFKVPGGGAICIIM